MFGRPDVLEQAQLHFLGVAAAPAGVVVAPEAEELYTEDSRARIWQGGIRTGNDMNEARCSHCRKRTPLDVMWETTIKGLCPYCNEATIIV